MSILYIINSFNVISTILTTWHFKGSECDKLGGFDGATLPPGLGQSDVIDMFISLMCRKIDLNFEKVSSKQNIFVKLLNASHASFKTTNKSVCLTIIFGCSTFPVRFSDF